MIESVPPYQVATVLDGRPLLIQVRDHSVQSDGSVVFDHEVYDVEEDCLLTPTPEQARFIWNVLMTDLETICQ